MNDPVEPQTYEPVMSREERAQYEQQRVDMDLEFAAVGVARAFGAIRQRLKEILATHRTDTKQYRRLRMDEEVESIRFQAANILSLTNPLPTGR